MNERWVEKSFEHLEWHRLSKAVLARCRSESARRRGLPFAADAEHARSGLEETREATNLHANGTPLPLDGLRDLQVHLERLERDGVLDAPALADVLSALGAARMLRDFFAEHREQTPMLQRACVLDPSLDALEDSLSEAVEPDGRLSDRASPDLHRLRTEVANLRERIVGRLAQLIDRHEAVLQERYYTLREDRYVLPVRRDAHERVPGIVHGTSQSGASVFVEPRAIVAHGNRLKMAQSELEREELRILGALSDALRERHAALSAAAAGLDLADVRSACAQIGIELAGVVPELAEAPSIELRAARHPLLVLDGIDVVPNDLAVKSGSGLVLSGPNAGGKTVLLKTLGLCALSARHGVPVAAAEGSRVGFFDRVLTDVGDEQSTAHNLSTFSAHVRNLSHVLADAGPSSLVLLDELAGGTDPEQGAALACAIVETLCEQGAALAVTTHYDPLKALAMRAPALRVGSVGFDVERMEPSFRLTLDVPGASSALAVARRFGIPDAVIERAEAALPESTQHFDRLSRELAEALERAHAQRAELDAREAALARRSADVEARLAALRKKGDARIEREIATLVDDVRTARRELEAIRQTIKAAEPSRQALRQAERAVDAVAARVAIGGDLARAAGADSRDASRGSPPVDAAELIVGTRVNVPRLRAEAVVVEPPEGKRVRVAVGPMKLRVGLDEVERVTQKAREEAPPPVRSASSPSNDAPGPDNTVDVRGLRVDDALSLVETFVDRLYMTPARVGYVLHGHGTGALRDAVRHHLATAMPQVRESRPALAAEGGDAVTVFYL